MKTKKIIEFILIFFSLAWAFAALLILTILCYIALVIEGDGIVLLDFNSFHEGWFELTCGIIAGLILLKVIYNSIKDFTNQIKLEGKK